MTVSENAPEPTTASKTSERYIPALRFSSLTGFYDSLIAATLKEERFKGLLVEQARLEAGQRVLDLGCGTATLTIMLKRACPEAQVVGLDGDPEILRIARKKVADAGLDIELREGMAFAPPFMPRTLDRVVSSLVFHHLTTENKQRTFSKIREILRPGGELYMADWGTPHDPLMRLAFLAVQVFDGFATTSDNVNGRLLPMMRDAGFICVEETHRERTLFGTLSLFRAVAPNG